MIPGVTADDFVNPSFQLKTKKRVGQKALSPEPLERISAGWA